MVDSIRKLSQPRWHLIIVLFIIGYIGSQRFILPTVSANICILTLVFFIKNILSKKSDSYISYLILSLFLLVDNGADTYPETASFLRYVVYIASILVLLSSIEGKIKKKSAQRYVILVAFIGIGGFLSLFNIDIGFNYPTFKRDVFALIMLSVFCFKRKKINIDLNIIFWCVLGYLIGEVVNSLLFFNVNHYGYMNYDSLKAFVIFPALYVYVYTKKIFFVVPLILLVFYILSFYGSRMITISLFFFVFLFLVKTSFGGGKYNYLFALVIGLALILVGSTLGNISEYLLSDRIATYKAISFIGGFLENIMGSSLLESIRYLDSVRYEEHNLFFSRGFFEIIFGSGLGASIIDSNNLLGFVGYDQTAFSKQELQQSTFYNLHDFWIDYGLRFGLLPVFYLFYKVVIRNIFSDNSWVGILFGILLINTTFSTSGIIFTALLIQSLRKKQYN